jgi:hypothetical protein
MTDSNSRPLTSVRAIFLELLRAVPKQCAWTGALGLGRGIPTQLSNDILASPRRQNAVAWGAFPEQGTFVRNGKGKRCEIKICAVWRSRIYPQAL